MVDSVSPAQRSRNMARIRSRDTTPELLVRSLLHRAGFRFRLHRKNLPGTPDIVLPKHKTVIFVNGCFWHQHPGCRRATLPKTNREYWIPKLLKNVVRDAKHLEQLKKANWRVLCLWECETTNRSDLAEKLVKFLRGLTSRSAL